MLNVVHARTALRQWQGWQPDRGVCPVDERPVANLAGNDTGTTRRAHPAHVPGSVATRRRVGRQAWHVAMQVGGAFGPGTIERDD